MMEAGHTRWPFLAKFIELDCHYLILTSFCTISDSIFVTLQCPFQCPRKNVVI